MLLSAFSWTYCDFHRQHVYIPGRSKEGRKTPVLSVFFLSGKKVGSADFLYRLVEKIDISWLLLAVKKTEAVSILFLQFILVEESKGGSGSEDWVSVCFAMSYIPNSLCLASKSAWQQRSVLLISLYLIHLGQSSSPMGSGRGG